MKKILVLIFVLFQTSLFFAENNNLPSEKATVYFARANGLGALINFTYFDGDKAIGRFNGPKYMKYECEPGKHLFWARSENKSFVEADLEAGKIYIIDVIPKMGAFKAAVSLVPVDKSDYKLKHIQKLLSKRESESFSSSELDALGTEMSEVIKSGMDRYNNLKERGKLIPQLKANMSVEKSDLVFVKKKKKK